MYYTLISVSNERCPMDSVHTPYSILGLFSIGNYVTINRTLHSKIINTML